MMRSCFFVACMSVFSLFANAKTTDWSDSTKIKIAEPTFAHINITGISALPQAKEVDSLAWLEFDDGQGNTFRKRIIINAQGNSSLSFPKKNMAIDFCEDEWIGEKTTSIRFGNWVNQDGFHLKAYYNDYFRGQGAAMFRLYDEIEQTLPDSINMPWKRAGIDDEKRALCHPEGFPCEVSLNGEFYGVYSLQLKKHRKNMNMKKDNPLHIHLDGTIYDATLFGGTINWDQFEIRNPKEPTDETRQAISNLSHYKAEIDSMAAAGASVEDIRKVIAERFDVQSLIDYYIFGLVTNNYDGYIKNWQWFTYDGKKWYVEPYDLDGLFGAIFTGELVMPARWGMLDDDFTMIKEYVSYGPIMHIVNYYLDDLKARYAELRDMAVLTPGNITDYVKQWQARIPEEEMAKEWQRWPDCNCINPTETNEGWKQIDDYTGWIELPNYNDTVTYYPGDRVTINKYCFLSVWEATDTIVGVFPYIKVGYNDSVERVEAYVSHRLPLIDDYLDYYDESAEKWLAMNVTAKIENKHVTNVLNYGTMTMTQDSLVYKYLLNHWTDYKYKRLDRPDDAIIPVSHALAENYKLIINNVTTPEHVDTISVAPDTENLHVRNLVPNEEYSYAVVSPWGHTVTSGTLKTEGQVRMLNIDGGCNIRDIGGWKLEKGGEVKYGLVYRGSELTDGLYFNATDGGLQELKRIGIGSQLDLRYYYNLQNNSHAGPGRNAWNDDSPYYYADIYDHDNMIVYEASKFRKSYEFIAQQLRLGNPVYVHCTRGADRTGLVIAIVEASIGVNLDNILKDYELTGLTYVLGRRFGQTLVTRLFSKIGYKEGGDKSLQNCCNDYLINVLGIKSSDIDDVCRILTERSYVLDIETISKVSSEGNQIYDINGIRKNTMTSGINILKNNNGKVYKVIK